jgi:hypothetical protein
MNNIIRDFYDELLNRDVANIKIYADRFSTIVEILRDLAAKHSDLDWKFNTADLENVVDVEFYRPAWFTTSKFKFRFPICHFCRDLIYCEDVVES